MSYPRPKQCWPRSTMPSLLTIQKTRPPDPLRPPNNSLEPTLPALSRISCDTRSGLARRLCSTPFARRVGHPESRGREKRVRRWWAAREHCVEADPTTLAGGVPACPEVGGPVEQSRAGQLNSARSRAAWVAQSHGAVRGTSADAGRCANTALKLTRPRWPVVGVRARKLVGRSRESRAGQLNSAR